MSKVKVILIAGCVAAAFVGVTALAVPFLVSSDVLLQAFEKETLRRTGFALKIDGQASAYALPWPGLYLKRVRLGSSPQGVSMSADALSASLKLFPLLKGQMIFSDYELKRATIRLPSLISDSQFNWSDVEITAKKLVDDQSDGAALPGLRLTDSTLELIDDQGKVQADVTALTGEMSWPGLTAGASLQGRGLLNGAAASLSGSIKSPVSLVLGKPSAFEFSLLSEPLSVRFDGSLTAGYRSTAEGDLSLETRSLSKAADLVQGRVTVTSDRNDAFAVNGRALISNGIISVTNANAQFGKNAAKGAVSISEQNGRLIIRGTLDANRIDLTPYLNAYSPGIAAEQGGWNKNELEVASLNATDLDVRLSADLLSFGSVMVQDAAAVALAREGRLTITLAEAKAHGGTIKGGFIVTSVKDQPGMADVNGDFALQNVELGQGLAEWFGLKRLQGRGSIRLAISGRGSSVQSLMRQLGGKGRFTATQGQITGLDIESILKRLERRPLSVATQPVDLNSGLTRYDTIAADITIERGVATTQNLLMDSPKTRVTLTGSLVLPTREIDMKGVATLKNGENGAPFELPFLVRSTWDDPFLLPDGDNLIRRSNAATPLRDVTRDRDRLKAIEEAIKQSGGAADQAMPPVDLRNFLPLR